MNPYIVGGTALLLTSTAFATGWKVSSWRHDAQELRDTQLAEKLSAAATSAAVNVAKTLQPKYTTINRAVEREITTNTIYGDCKHTDAAWLQIRAAYEAAGGTWGDTGAVPDAATPVGR